MYTKQTKIEKEKGKKERRKNTTYRRNILKQTQHLEKMNITELLSFTEYYIFVGQYIGHTNLK